MCNHVTGTIAERKRTLHARYLVIARRHNRRVERLVRGKALVDFKPKLTRGQESLTDFVVLADGCGERTPSVEIAVRNGSVMFTSRPPDLSKRNK